MEPVGEGVSERRIDHGPGYRDYFVQRGRALIILLCDGGRDTQRRNITRAKQLAVEVEDGED